MQYSIFRKNGLYLVIGKELLKKQEEIFEGFTAALSLFWVGPAGCPFCHFRKLLCGNPGVTSAFMAGQLPWIPA